MTPPILVQCTLHVQDAFEVFDITLALKGGSDSFEEQVDCL